VDAIEPNDILITYSIDISWSVYFFMLAGIVTEVGGIVSHGAVVAREYGLPTLCTAVGACTTFKTGQQVTLDASAGRCYLVTAQEEATAATSSAGS
jgi:phosphohistidine swiveling domain-containing protein